MTGALASVARALLVLTLSTAVAAAAEPVTLRMAAIAPEGTAWARDMRSFARDIEASTHGEVRVKWYLNGIAGDELQATERMKHGQLDGEAGAIFCQSLAPTLRVLRVAGLFRSRDEVSYVISRLKPRIDEEMHQAGYVNLGEGIFGLDTLFSRRPIRSLGQLRATRIWNWDIDHVWGATLTAMGVPVVTATVNELAPQYRDGKFDAFFVTPTVALAFQWSAEARYYIDLGATALPACAVVSERAMDVLPLELRQQVETAAAKYMAHMTTIGEQIDRQLLDELFVRQGLQKLPATASLRNDIAAAARQARAKLGGALVPPALVDEVERMLSDYRKERAR